MKKLTLLVLVAVAVHFSAHAQLNQNSWLVGGSAGITSTSNTQFSNETTTNTTYTISPRAGYFLIDRLAAGIGVATAFTHLHYNDLINSSSFNSTAYSFGPFVRYYFLPRATTAKILLEVFDQYNISTATGTANVHSNQYGFDAGPAFFINPFVALEVTIGYYWTNNSVRASPTDVHTFKTSIGFQVYLPGKGHKS